MTINTEYIKLKMKLHRMCSPFIVEYILQHHPSTEIVRMSKKIKKLEIENPELLV